jgi:IS30 family transposase
MAQRISEELKKKILKSVEEDWLPVAKASKEYWVHHKTIYNWLNKNVVWNWWTNASYWEIKRLKRDKDDLLLIIWELTAEINLSKKKKLR